MQVKREHPGEDLNKILGEKWKALPVAEKEPYKQMQEKDKLRSTAELLEHTV